MGAIYAADRGFYMSAAEAVGRKTSFTMAAVGRGCQQVIL